MFTKATGRGYANCAGRGCTLLAGLGLVAALMCSSAIPASAQTWTGTTSNDWTRGSNWSTGLAPTAGASVFINTTSPTPDGTVIGFGRPAAVSVNQLYLGTSVGATGQLTIQNGSVLTSTANVSRIGVAGGSTGTVTVTGAGSQWVLSAGNFAIGFGGNGTLNILDGAKVVAPGPGSTILGNGPSASGTLNISGGGTLETGTLWSRVNDAHANFDNGILRATADNPTFIRDFSGTELNILSGGLTVDTNGFNVGTDAASAFTGVGGLTKIGTTTLNLAANNTYAGETLIQTGTLELTGLGSVASSSRIVANGTFDISGVAATSSSIQSLAGSGTVALGTKNLNITNANDTFAGVIGGTGGLVLSGGTQTLAGTNTYSGGTTISAGTLQLGNGGTRGSIVGNVTNNAALAFNRSDALTYGGVISGTGVVNQIGTGTTILTGANIYTGATNINSGTLRINGNQTGATGLTSVFAGGTLGGTGILGGGLTAFAGGTIAPGNSIGTLTVNGNYTSNGGTLAVEAQLGGDASPADLLLINGNSLLGLAPTLVEVTNVGGLGGVTTNGIKIVDVAGLTSDAGVFVLNGPAIGGAYSYNLFQNDLATGTDGDWYLRSAGLAPTTPTFENYPVALLGMTELPTLRQRVGDRTEAADGVWSRIEGAAGHYQANSSSAGASHDSSLFLAQIGVEGALVDGPEGSLVAGFSTQYSRNAATVFSAYGNGSNVTEGMGIGASLTWRGAGGTYLDLQGQLARFWTDLDAIGYRLVTDNGGTGLAVSLEAGHEIALDDAWSITPQAQLSYASVGFDSFTDRFGSVISLEAGNSLKGRVGVAVDYRTDWPDQKASASINGVANLTYEFLDGATVAVSGTNLHYAAQKFGAELGLGGTLEWNGGAQALHAEVLAATSFQGSYAVKGTVGFKAGF